MKLGFRLRLFLLTVGIITACFVGADLYLAHALNTQLTDRIQDAARVSLGLVEHDVSDSSAALEDAVAWTAFAHDLGARARARISIIRLDGRLVGDSDLDAADLATAANHVDRVEVREALERGIGSDVRVSDTVHARMAYVAMPFRRAGAVAGTVRIATPLTEVDAAVGRVHGALLAASGVAYLLGILFAGAMAQAFGRTVGTLLTSARRMADGDLRVRTHIDGEDELAQLGKALDQIAIGLSEAITDLRTERDLIGAVLDGMEEGVLVLDGAGHVVRMNNAVRAMLLLGDAAIGRPLLDVVRNADVKELVDAASESVATGEIELLGLTPRRLMMRAATLPGDEGARLVVFRDVTDMRRLETMRRDFVANVSHELRTPVTAVRSAAETLQGGAAEDPRARQKFIDAIARNAERLQRLIEDLLDLSKIESKQLALKVEAVDVAAIAAHALGLVREKAEERGVRLVHAVDADVPHVTADRRALEQVLANLLENAIKYCPGATVTIRAAARDERVSISVDDTGSGIAPQHVPRLFERFYRVDAGRSRDIGGTGLGLAIVKHLTEAMGGNVSVESVLGRGTTFTVSLPEAPREDGANVSEN